MKTGIFSFIFIFMPIAMFGSNFLPENSQSRSSEKNMTKLVEQGSKFFNLQEGLNLTKLCNHVVDIVLPKHADFDNGSHEYKKSLNKILNKFFNQHLNTRISYFLAFRKFEVTTILNKKQEDSLPFLLLRSIQMLSKGLILDPNIDHEGNAIEFFYLKYLVPAEEMFFVPDFYEMIESILEKSSDLIFDLKDGEKRNEFIVDLLDLNIFLLNNSVGFNYLLQPRLHGINSLLPYELIKIREANDQIKWSEIDVLKYFFNWLKVDLTESYDTFLDRDDYVIHMQDMITRFINKNYVREELSEHDAALVILAAASIAIKSGENLAVYLSDILTALNGAGIGSISIDELKKAELKLLCALDFRALHPKDVKSIQDSAVDQ